MTYRAGLLRRGCENLVPYLVAAFTKGGEWSKKDWDTISEFTNVFGISVVEDGDRRKSLPIEFLGLFDSVKALGSLRWSPRYPFTRKLPRVKYVRHAIAIDEQRRPYPEYPVALDEDNSETELVEAWFAGVHSDIGGAFESKGALGGLRLSGWSTRRFSWPSSAAKDLLDASRTLLRRCHCGDSQEQPGLGLADSQKASNAGRSTHSCECTAAPRAAFRLPTEARSGSRAMG